MVQGRHHLTLRSSVHAYIAGEHDDSEIPLWTSASIGAVPLLDWEAGAEPALDARGRDDILGEVVHAAEEIIPASGRPTMRSAWPERVWSASRSV